jgi:CRISPR-associated protein Cmr4
MVDIITLYIYTESALHAGTGTALGAVDLPIQREQTTGYPMIQGSGVKGALRSQTPKASGTADEKKDVEVVFGPDNRSGGVPDFAGAAAFGDARVLLFPVRALNGVFVWTTSREVLARFVRDCRLQGTPPLPTAPQGNNALVSDLSIAANSKIVLEEYLYQVSPLSDSQQQADNWAVWLAENALPTEQDSREVYDSHYKEALKKRLVVLPDNDFRDFTLYATQIVPRVALSDATKTVEQGPFTMELLPADTLLYAPITAQNPRGVSSAFPQGSTSQVVLNWLTSQCFPATDKPPRIQIGGDETVGYGRVALRWGA